MSAPYTIRWGYCQENSESIGADLARAIARCREIDDAYTGGWSRPQIFGDNIDLDCADGLSQDERDQIDEATYAAMQRLAERQTR